MKQAAQPVEARSRVHSARPRRIAVIAVSKPSRTCLYTALSPGSGAPGCNGALLYPAAIRPPWNLAPRHAASGGLPAQKTNNPVVCNSTRTNDEK